MNHKSKGVALLSQLDMGANRFGKPIVGWQSTSQGYGLYNPAGWAMLRIVLQEQEQPLYDSVMLVESPGCIVIAQLGDRIGLIQNFRMVGERLIGEAGQAYVRRLEAEGLWDELMASLGRWCWEAPRGLAPPSEGEDELKEFLLKTALREAREEAGFIISNAQIVGQVNANSTFFAHAQYVVLAQIDRIGQAAPEDLEMIGKQRLFSRQQLRDLVKAGEFDDGLTLAALAICGWSF